MFIAFIFSSVRLLSLPHASHYSRKLAGRLDFFSGKGYEKNKCVCVGGGVLRKFRWPQRPADVTSTSTSYWMYLDTSDVFKVRIIIFQSKIYGPITHTLLLQLFCFRIRGRLCLLERWAGQQSQRGAWWAPRRRVRQRHKDILLLPRRRVCLQPYLPPYRRSLLPAQVQSRVPDGKNPETNFAEYDIVFMVLLWYMLINSFAQNNHKHLFHSYSSINPLEKQTDWNLLAYITYRMWIQMTLLFLYMVNLHCLNTKLWNWMQTIKFHFQCIELSFACFACSVSSKFSTKYKTFPHVLS